MRIYTTDTESNGLVVGATRLWCASGVWHDNPEEIRSYIFNKENEGDKAAYLKELDRAQVIVGHNLIGHDLPLLKKLWGWEPKPQQRLVDTLIMSRMLDPNRKLPPHTPKGITPHSVAGWGYRFGDYKIEYEEWWHYTPQMLERNRHDVRLQYRIYNELLKEMRSTGGWGAALRLMMDLLPMLREQEENGIAVDYDLMVSTVARIDRWIAKIDRAVQPYLPVVLEIEEGKIKGEYGYVKKPFKKDGSYSKVTERFLAKYYDGADDIGYTVAGSVPNPIHIAGPFARVSFRYTNLDSNAEVKDFLLKSGWQPAYWNENNAGERTTPKLTQDEPFHGVQGSLGKLLVKRVQCRQRRGVIQGWLDYIREHRSISLSITDPWRRYRPVKPSLPGAVAGFAVTGRARHRTVVNVPGSDAFLGATMRSMFIARPGNVLVGIDSKGNQIRQLAARMGDEEFTSVVLDETKDVHSFTQERGNISTRHKAKTFFYSLIFGAGDPKIARTLSIPVSEAKALRSEFFSGMPKLAALIDSLTKEWKQEGGIVRGIDGRPIKIESPHQILVYVLQSDEAIQMAKAYVLLYWALDELLPRNKWRFVLWMHDEFQIECTPDVADIVVDRGCWAIAEAGRMLGIPVPHEGEAKIGCNWSETH